MGRNGAYLRLFVVWGRAADDVAVPLVRIRVLWPPGGAASAGLGGAHNLPLR